MSQTVSYHGADSFYTWSDSDTSRDNVDIVLLTHPRDEDDSTRLFPCASKLTHAERASIQRNLKPVFGEIVETEYFTVGILFLPFYAEELLDPKQRRRCAETLEDDAVRMAAKAGARILCLGGLTGALSLYGRRLREPAQKFGMSVTTGHALTTVGVHQTYERALAQLGRTPRTQRVTVLGVGSIGRAFVELLGEDESLPNEIVLVDRPQMAGKLKNIADEFESRSGLSVSVEITESNGALRLDSACYQTDVLVSATSSPYIVDVDKIRPGSILIDDSQPYCWSRERAWERFRDRSDIVPCEAGLVDCTSIGYSAYFDFDFADTEADGRSTTAWTCQTEGMLLALNPDLPTTVGNPSRDVIASYRDTFIESGLRVPDLQCGLHRLPIDDLRTELLEEIPVTQR